MSTYHLAFLFLLTTSVSWAGILSRGPARMMCHRTANTEMPENTLASLELAALMGCSVVEVDVRMTLDGELILQHDGFLERLTNGLGEADKSYFEELEYLDAGSWMGSRFSGLRIPRLVDALHLAKKYGIALVLDIKQKESTPAILALLRDEQMLDKVRLGGEPDDPTIFVESSITRQEIEKLHQEGKVVVANFSANGREMDLADMREAVADGVDWINVDYPRLGADAIGQPVETKIAALVKTADTGRSLDRAKAILTLAHFQGFPLQSLFHRWLLAQDDYISRAAAIALLSLRPAAPDSLFTNSLSAPSAAARKNAAWILGLRAAPVVPLLLSLLNDQDLRVLREALLALSRCPGDVPANRIEPFLSHSDALVRGAAALALAKHHPEIASQAVRRALRQEEEAVAEQYAPYIGHGAPRLPPAEIAAAVNHYRALMKLAESGSFLKQQDAQPFFEQQAFRSVQDYSATVGPVAGYQLWDRVAADPRATIAALTSEDVTVAERAEWIVIHAGPDVLPSVRPLLESATPAIRERAVTIVAWQYDVQSLPALRALRDSGKIPPAVADWAIKKIQGMASLMQ